MISGDALRRMILLDWLKGMPEDQKRALSDVRGRIPDDVRPEQTGYRDYLTDLLANVSGNAVYNAIIWAGKNIIKRVGAWK